MRDKLNMKELINIISLKNNLCVWKQKRNVKWNVKNDKNKYSHWRYCTSSFIMLHQNLGRHLPFNELWLNMKEKWEFLNVPETTTNHHHIDTKTEGEITFSDTSTETSDETSSSKSCWTGLRGLQVVTWCFTSTWNTGDADLSDILKIDGGEIF